MHDCAKNFCDEVSYKELHKIAEKNGIVLDEFFKINPSLAHSYIGAIFAKNLYGITDIEILDAISSHTFAEKDMGIIAKIVYIADFIEPSRPQNKTREKAQQILNEGINQTLKFILDYTIQKNQKKALPIYHKTIEAINYLEEHNADN